MTTIGEAGVTLVVMAGMLLLSIGLGALTLVENRQIKVHALALGAMGPVLVLLTSPFWAEGRMLATALLLSGFLLLTSAVSAHAIMGLVASQGDWRSEGPSESADDRPGPSGGP